jgi:hypothetical protein
VNQLLDLAFHQPADRNVGPFGDDFRDVFLVNLFLQHLLRLLQLGQLRLGFTDLALDLRERSDCSSEAF